MFARSHGARPGARVAACARMTNLCAALTCVVLAGGYRVMTAGVIGANIGAGLFLLFGLPFCVCLLVLSCIISFKTVRHPSARVQTEAPRPG